MRNRLIVILLALWTSALIVGSVTAAVSPRTSATLKVSCNHDGSINLETVPLNHQ